MASPSTHPAPQFPPPAQALRPVAVGQAKWFRVHRFNAITKKYGATQFNDTTNGNARFSPLIDPATGNVIPTIYAANTRRGAIAEIILHDVPTPSTGHLHDWDADKKSDFHLSEIELPNLTMANFFSTGLKAADVDHVAVFSPNQSDYPRSRAWALHVWQTMPTVQGIIWMSVRDNQGQVLILFGDRIASGALTDLKNTQPIASFEPDVIALLYELGCGLVLD